eukprot:symbB.v1.2.027230.t2/scaffold2778.1/size70658/8
MNNYHLYEEIGRGKYSQVYKGRKKFTIQFVAVKSIEKCRREKVMTEVELLSGLHHANVIEFVNCYETRNHLWVIFEYCAGGDLLRLLKQDSRLPEERVRVFGRQICAGLLHLHSRGIIFCDLKPSNILFTEDEILKLSHFGQALRMEAVESQAPSRRGTPQYMAPELFSEAGVHSFSSDLWSLGCVLHELFLGSPPFTSVSSQQLATAVVTAAVPKMPGATPEFQDLTLDLLRPLHRRIAWPQLRSHRWWRGERLGEDNDVAHVPKKRPPRRWMSVSDLVTEVEQALVEGERLDEDSPAYFNLRREARDGADVSALWIFGAVELWKALSLRLENDALNEKVAELEEARAQYIAQEEGLTAKLKEDGGFFAHEKDIMEMTSKIQEVDYKIAGLRHKHHHNIKDVGSLKRTMSLIEKRGKVTTLIDKTEEALDKGEVSHAVQLEADLTQVVERLRQESAKIWPKISSYEANIADLSGKMSETQNQLQAVLHTPTREADDLRTFLKSQINQVKRMLAQLGRLRDIQRVNAQEIGMVERERAKLQRYCLVRELLEEGDKAKLRDKITVLQEDADRQGCCQHTTTAVIVPQTEDEDAWRAWAETWVSWDPNPTTRKELQSIQLAGDVAKLRKLLGRRLEFGTAGLRGAMGLGSCCMNDLVVLQSSQGVCAYLESVFGSAAQSRGICVGFDHRAAAGCSSKSFALQVARVFLLRGFKVWLFRDVVATPMVPWCLEQCGCCAGVMITASHNPAADNGYKLYWSNGAQIIPPHDAKVAQLIEENLEPWASQPGDLEAEVISNPLCKDPKEDGVLDAYFQRLQTLRCSEELLQGCAELELLTLTVLTEEGKGALKLAFEEADKVPSINLVLANDPDADRLAVAEREPGGHAWHVFTGNELGALLGHWAWCCWRKKNPPPADAAKVCMVGSAVSSKFLASMAAKEGFRFVETLTGFKWMGSKSADLRAEGYDVIFAYEEAIGFCCGDMVKDKDGIAAASVFVEMAKSLSHEGRSCRQHLRELYEKYGTLQSLNSYLKSPDPSITTRIFAAQRGKDPSSYPKRLGDFAVTAVRDLTIGYDSRTPDGKPELPLNLGGEMITYYFDEASSAEVTLRSSGTEPKIKFYSEMHSRDDVQLRSLVRHVVLRLLDPVTHGLEMRPEDKELLSLGCGVGLWVVPCGSDGCCLLRKAERIINKLRSMPFEFTTETGKLREQLIANIHQESSWKERLAVLRGEKLQNIRFIAMLMKALDA